MGPTSKMSFNDVPDDVLTEASNTIHSLLAVLYSFLKHAWEGKILLGNVLEVGRTGSTCPRSKYSFTTSENCSN